MAIPESEVARITAVVPSCSGSSTVISTSRLGVLGERDLVDRADRLAADQDLVAGDELAAGLEQELVLVPLVAAEEQQRDEHDGDDERADPRDPRQEPSRSSAIRLLSLHSGTAFACSSLPTCCRAFTPEASSRLPEPAHQSADLYPRAS